MAVLDAANARRILGDFAKTRAIIDGLAADPL